MECCKRFYWRLAMDILYKLQHRVVKRNGRPPNFEREGLDIFLANIARF